MAYVKQNFVDGNVLYASELNHIEDGIADAYIKPSGGIPTADIANGAVTAVKIAANAVSTLYTATIPANGWGEMEASGSSIVQVTVQGLLSTDQPIVDLAIMSISGVANRIAANEAWGNIFQASTAANRIDFRTTEIPEMDLPIKILCIRK